MSTVPSTPANDQPPREEGIRRPADIPHSTTLDAILRLFHALTGRVINARHGIGEALPRPQLAESALGLIATQHALADRVLAGRWVNAVDALTYGATLDQVAEAMDVTGPEVVAGLTSWADGQLQLHRDLGVGLTAAGHAEVLALLDAYRG